MNTLSSFLTVAFASAVAIGSAQAQEAIHRGYPNVDRPVAIAPGETVHVLNHLLVDRAPGMRAVRRLDFQYRTTIPASDAAAREAQALRAAQFFGAAADESKSPMLSIAICDTDACGKRDEPPRVWYVYEKGAGGVWRRIKQ